MLPQLTKRQEFVEAARKGRKIVTRTLILQVMPCPHGTLRTGFTATRKLGNAVTRNRVKRRLRAVAAEVLPQQALSGYDYVLIGRGATADCPYAQLVNDLGYALKKAGVRKDS